MVLMTHAETVHTHVFLPKPAHDLWAAGKLHEFLDVPNDGTRVEIIGGEIVVSSAPQFGRNVVANFMQKLFSVAEATRDDFRWEITQGNGLDLAGSSDGYIPDLLCVSSDTYASLVAQKPVKVPAECAALVVEITSPSNAAEGRKPGPKRERPTKWSGYAREGIAHYLLIDRDPKVLKAILYSDPDRTTGKYRASTAWPFGKTIDLPDPFAVEIPTATWQPWTA